MSTKSENESQGLSRREQKAALEPDLGDVPLGCIAVVLVSSAAFVVLAAYSEDSNLILYPLIVSVAILVWLVAGRMIRIAVWLQWSRKGKLGLLVYSNSPHWKEYIDQEWLPRYLENFVVLNWSERSKWPRSLEVTVFKSFCDSDRNFNPAVVLFRGFRRPLVFRFFEAFTLAKHGKIRALEHLERQLFNELSVDYPGCTYQAKEGD